jgi:hypothetical protein
MTLQDKIVAAIRTAAAGLGAAFLSWLLVQFGWDFPDEVDAQVALVIFLVLMAVWNFVVNFLAARVHPAFGYLLLVPKQPAYDPAKPLLIPDTPPAQVTVGLEVPPPDA